MYAGIERISATGTTTVVGQLDTSSGAGRAGLSQKMLRATVAGRGSTPCFSSEGALTRVLILGQILKRTVEGGEVLEDRFEVRDAQRDINSTHRFAHLMPRTIIYMYAITIESIW